MKHLSIFLALTILLTACEQTEELSFEEQAARDQAEAEERMAEFEAQQEADEIIFAQMQPADEDGDGYKTFTAEDYGVSFDFPAEWNFELSRYGAEGYRVDLHNEEPQDGCTATGAGVVFTFPNPKDSALAFEDFVMSDEVYDADGSLGQLGGDLTPLTIGESEAFHAEISGYEALRCEDDAYVVEMNASEYMFIGVFTGTAGNEAEEIQKILDSLQL